MLTSCLEESTIWAFLHGELTPEEVAPVRSHVDDCAECRSLVAMVARSLSAGSPAPEAATIAEPPSQRDAASDAASPEARPLAEGDIVAGKYRVERLLGKGGTAYVVAARHIHLGTRVALKLLHAHVVWDSDARGRFAREARAAARILSPHVVRVLDVDTLEDGAPFLVMELLEGNDLAAELTERGKIPVPEALRYVLEATLALAEVHRAGIIHRDLKPANMFLARRDGTRTLKLLDFGTSKTVTASFGSVDEFRTSQVTWIGTPRYMAPEQLTLGQPVDERTDIWALGVLMHHLMAGSPPFRGESLEEHCRAVLTEAPIALDAALLTAPPGLAAVILRCLSKDSAARYATVADLARALSPFVEDRALIDAIARASARDEDVERTQAPAPTQSRRRTLRRLAVAMSALALLAAAVGATRSPGRSAPPVSSASSAAIVAATVADPALAPSTASQPAAPASLPTTSASLPPRPAAHAAPRPRHAEFGARR